MTEARNPQLEDGHIRIANELFDAILGFPFTHRQHKVVFTIIRKTYGYGKKEDDISASQIGEYCMIPRNHVTQELNKLVDLNVIHKRPGRYGSVVGINKDYSKWIDPEVLKGNKAKPRGLRTLDAAHEKLHHYVYKITEPSTGRYYIGVRSCNCLPAQDRYVGSGNWVATIDKRLVEKEVLATFESRDEAEKAEVEYIKSATGLIMNHRLYARTESVTGDTESVPPSRTESVTGTESVLGQKAHSTRTESVQVDRTESVHTKDNLPKDNLQNNPPSPPGGKTDSKAGKTKTAPPDGFVLAWNEYPKRDGANPKRDALNSWRARVREGVDEEIMIGATKAYAAAMSEKGKVGTEFVMQAKRFYGPSRPFEDYMAGSPQEGWWVSAGFKNPYEAENAGCTERTAYLWREGKRLEATA